MSILDDTRIAEDVYKYTTLEDQLKILECLDHENDCDEDSIQGLIIVRWVSGNYGAPWSEVQIIDSEEINL